MLSFRLKWLMSYILVIVWIVIFFLMWGFMCIFYFKYKKVDLCYVIDVDLSFYLWYMEVLFVSVCFWDEIKLCLCFLGC